MSRTINYARNTVEVRNRPTKNFNLGTEAYVEKLKNLNTCTDDISLVISEIINSKNLKMNKKKQEIFMAVAKNKFLQCKSIGVQWPKQQFGALLREFKKRNNERENTTKAIEEVVPPPITTAAIKKKIHVYDIVKPKDANKNVVAANDGKANDGKANDISSATFTERLPFIISKIDQKSNDDLKLEGLVELRKATSGSQLKEDVFKIIDRQDIMPLLVRVLTSAYDGKKSTMQFEALWILTNVASTSSSDIALHVFNNVLKVNTSSLKPDVVRLIKSKNPCVAEQSIWLIGNLCGEANLQSNIVCMADVVESTVQVLANRKLNQAPNSLLNIAGWTMYNFCSKRCKWKANSKHWKIIKECLPTLGSIINDEECDHELLNDILFCVQEITGGENELIQDIIQVNNLVPRCCQLLSHKEKNISQRSLHIVGNIVTGSEEQTDAAVIGANLPYYIHMNMYKWKFNQDVKNVVWLISNIMASNTNHIQSCLDIKGFFEHNVLDVFDMHFQLNDKSSKSIVKETIYAISNLMTSGNEQQIQKSIEMGCVSKLLNVINRYSLSSDEHGNEMIKVASTGLIKVLKTGIKQMRRRQEADNAWNHLIFGRTDVYSMLLSQSKILENTIIVSLNSTSEVIELKSLLRELFLSVTNNDASIFI